MPETSCFHCGLPVSGNTEFSVQIDGKSRPMCCIGCQAVASAIVNGGLQKFYEYRTNKFDSGAANASADDPASKEFDMYDLPGVQDDLVRINDEGRAVVELGISGISCAACAWLIEHHLNKLPGVEKVSVNVNRQYCRIQWLHDQLRLSQLLSAVSEIGYRPYPLTSLSRLEHLDRDQRRYILRLGLAGIGMMQAGMLAIGLYAGAFQGIEARWEELLRWVSLVVATPVVLYSAQPFFIGGWRSLKVLHLTMDVPIALAIALAYLASAWATITMTGEVYFDAVSMLTFFLLLGRFFEMRIRYRNELAAGEAAQLIPVTAMRSVVEHGANEDGAGFEQVPVKSLRVGDVIQIAEGESLPVDGFVLAGESRVQEAALTGEQKPLAKKPGDPVSAGTVNTVNRLLVKVVAVGKGTRLAVILDMLNGAIAEKPRLVELSDRIAAWFVALVLILATAIFASWYLHDPDRALWVTLSVLVVTCPCALSLATPAALAAATGQLQRQGLLVRRGHVLQTLPRLTRVILDKTGTLTSGKLKLVELVKFDADTKTFDAPGSVEESNAILDIVAALEQGCRHPIAMVFNQRKTTKRAENLDYQVGCGVRGDIDGQCYALGKPAFVAQVLDLDISALHRDRWPLSVGKGGGGYRTEIVLANRHGCYVRLVLVDALRPGAHELVRRLYAAGLKPELLSGDQEQSVGALARELGLKEWSAGNTPEAKLAHIRKRQEQGDRVLAVGDGINDVPVLSGADVSVAMGEATDFTRQASDSVLLSGNLNTLADAVIVAAKTETIIRQNIIWALVYNFTALPLAGLGWVPPWAAAIGMSASSLVVVLNALRLQSGGRGKAKLDILETSSMVAATEVGA